MPIYSSHPYESVLQIKTLSDLDTNVSVHLLKGPLRRLCTAEYVHAALLVDVRSAGVFLVNT
jgi:hypothetical protein